MRRLLALLLWLPLLAVGQVNSYNILDQPVRTNPTLQQDLIGNVTNPAMNGKTRGFVFAKVTGLNNTLCDMWEGPACLYVFPTAGQQMRVVSTSASDMTGSTGAQKVMIHYLDHNYAMQSETITLNGTTPVTSTTLDIFRVNYFHVRQVGSGGLAAGNISLQSAGGAVTYGYVTAGHNTARQGIYTVPAGVNGYISHWQASSASSAGTHYGQISIVATNHDGMAVPGLFLVQDELLGQNSSQETNYEIPLRIPATADVKMQAVSDSGSANVTALGAIMGWFE